MDYTQQIAKYFELEKQIIDSISKIDLSQVMNVLEQARQDGRQVFVMGNGGR